MERLGVDSVGEFYLGFDFGSARFGHDEQIFGRVPRSEILRKEKRMDRHGRIFVPKESVGGVSFEPRRMGSERSIVIRLSGELSSVHGAVEPGR